MAPCGAGNAMSMTMPSMTLWLSTGAPVALQTQKLDTEVVQIVQPIS